jgi:hypothetical protein
VIAALIVLVLQLLAQQPAPAVQTPPAPAVVAPAAHNPSPMPPALSGGDGPAERSDTVPACAAGEEWDGLRCVALQLPEETDGRQYDPAD